MIAVTLALASAMFFGAAAILTRKGIHREADTYQALIASIGTPFVLSAAVVVVLFPLDTVVGRQVLPFVAAGLAVPALSRLLLFLGYEKIGTARTASISGTAPLLSAVIALLFLREAVTWLGVVGIVLTVGGIAVLAEPHKETKTWKLSGLLLPLGAALLFAIRYTLSRYGLFASPALVGVTVVSGTSLIVLTLGGLVVSHRPLRRVSAPAGAFLLGSGLAYTGAYWCMFGAMAAEKLAIVVPLIHTDPLWTLLFSALFLREKHAITGALVLGTCLAFVGSVLIIAGR